MGPLSMHLPLRDMLRGNHQDEAAGRPSFQAVNISEATDFSRLSERRLCNFTKKDGNFHTLYALKIIFISAKIWMCSYPHPFDRLWLSLNP